MLAYCTINQKFAVSLITNETLRPGIYYSHFISLIMKGKNNIAIGFLTMAFFMAYGFLLIYLRDFAPGKAEWVNSYSIGKHFESRLAHVHGNLFAFLNILIGYLLLHFSSKLKNVTAISWLALTGLLMPVGILSEVYFGLPPILVLIGAIAMTASVAWLGFAFLKLKQLTQ
jgi:hypothetical protein